MRLAIRLLAYSDLRFCGTYGFGYLEIVEELCPYLYFDRALLEDKTD